MPLFITGSSGIGKSELVPHLRAALGEKFRVHDFDELLTKDVALNSNLLDEWRKNATRTWFQVAAREHAEGYTTVVVGLMFPSELNEASNHTEFRTLLLDCSQLEIERRLRGKRFSTDVKISKLKQGTGLTPEEFIAQNASTMQRLAFN